MKSRFQFAKYYINPMKHTSNLHILNLFRSITIISNHHTLSHFKSSKHGISKFHFKSYEITMVFRSSKSHFKSPKNTIFRMVMVMVMSLQSFHASAAVNMLLPPPTASTASRVYDKNGPIQRGLHPFLRGTMYVYIYI